MTTLDGHNFETGLRSWVQNSEIGLTHGATITYRLRDTLTDIVSSRQNRNTKSKSTTTEEIDNDLNDIGSVEYEEQVTEMYKTMMDGLMSAVHRNIPFYHVNRSTTGYHVTRDEEETLLRADPFESDEEEEYTSEAGEGEKPPNTTQQSPPQHTTAPDQRCKKREDLRKRRLEDEDLLVNQRMVRDEKGNMLVTIGPFPPPRLTIRSAKPNQCFPSRKTLQQRLNAEQAIDLSEQPEEEEQTSVATSSTAQPGYDASIHLAEFLKPLSMESLKKVSESAKVKIKPSSPAAEFIAQIVKAAIRHGCDKTTQLMDRKLSQSNTPLNLAARASAQFIENLSNEVKDALSLGLGLTSENSSPPEIWERIISIGLLSVLNNLHIRPLKKIGQELSLELADFPSTEKYCEAIVFGCFPMEKIRVRNSQKAKQHIGVAFNAPPSKMRCMGDMGMITFKVINISKMRKDSERHYSPEFEFGGLKWSVLCMNNKESLALYLCQTGTVYCKFFIQLQNKDPDDVIGNEGAQRFNSTSAENDWGFNNILKFDQLLEPQQGFWNEKDDSISIELGIAFVEVQNGADGKGDTSNTYREINGSTNGGGCGGSGAGKGKKSQQKINEDVAAAAAQLLEQERLEKERKKIKQLLSSTQKEEEKDRKELQTKRTKGFSDLMDSHRQEVKRIVREQKEFEKREQLDRAKEQERVQRAQEQNLENQRKIESLTEENQDLEEKKESLREGLVTLKEDLSNAKISLCNVEEEIQQYTAKLKQLEKRAKEREVELEELNEQEPPTPEEPVDDQEKEIRGELDALLAGI